jgi:hypothetical protein
MGFTCPTCLQPMPDGHEANYLGLAVSKIAGAIMWSEKCDLTPLRPRAQELLFEIVKGRERGARIAALRLLVSSGSKGTVAVHASAIRSWLDENCLPLLLLNDNFRYLLVWLPPDEGEA